MWENVLPDPEPNCDTDSIAKENKSAAGMHHTPPRNILDTKTIHNSSAITQMRKMPKIESENKFLTSIKGYNSVYLFVKIFPSAIPEHSFTILTLIPSLKKIGKGMPKIQSENKFLTSIKGRNSVLICQNLPICNPKTLLPNIISHSKFEESGEWKRCADGQTLERNFLNGGYNIIPHTF